MNEFKPTFGIEPTDDYLNAWKKLNDFYIAYQKLSSKEQERFKNEFIGGTLKSEIFNTIFLKLQGLGE